MNFLDTYLYFENYKEPSFYGVCGPNGSGKTNFLKFLYEREDNSCLVLDNTKFVCNTPIEEFELILSVKGYTNKEIKDSINNVINDFDLFPFINIPFKLLSLIEKKKISLVLAILREPRVLLLDNSISLFSKSYKKKVLDYLQKLSNKVTIVLSSCNLDDLIFCDCIIALYNQKSVFFGALNDFMSNSSFITKLGLKQPFMYELNEDLKHYNLISNTILNKKEMIDELWK